jgi:hypothetical protein
LPRSDDELTAYAEQLDPLGVELLGGAVVDLLRTIDVDDVGCEA